MSEVPEAEEVEKSNKKSVERLRSLVKEMKIVQKQEKAIHDDEEPPLLGPDWAGPTRPGSRSSKAPKS